jgi:hypothetical protein
LIFFIPVEIVLIKKYYIVPYLALKQPSLENDRVQGWYDEFTVKDSTWTPKTSIDMWHVKRKSIDMSDHSIMLPVQYTDREISISANYR